MHLLRHGLLVLALAFAVDGEAQVPIKTIVAASGFDRPLYATAPPGDAERLFVVEQVTARIWIVRNGEVLPTPFLDIDEKVSNAGGERGLLGLAFHPDYATNGYFYVNYTDNGRPGDTVIERYTVSDDPDVADPNSAFEILTIEQPFSNHNGGWMGFGPQDGYLYIASGDGGSSNDPNNNGQSLDTLLGKILRIDINGPNRYSIPAGNPFVSRQGARGEIWAYGLRNPWRCAFDRLTGDLYIGDVGQGAREEVDVQPGDSNGGENYGWKVAEGFACRGGTGNCGTQAGFTPPVHDYGRGSGSAVTGGYVYRGGDIPGLGGTYFFGDFGSEKIWSFRYVNGVVSAFIDRTDELTPEGATSVGAVASFGEDGRGELYIVDYGGKILKIVSARTEGDVNGDGVADARDVQLVVNGVLGVDTGSADLDVNDDGSVDALDVQAVVNSILGV